VLFARRREPAPASANAAGGHEPAGAAPGSAGATPVDASSSEAKQEAPTSLPGER